MAPKNDELLSISGRTPTIKQSVDTENSEF
jgi:hypothetical protein